MEIGWRACKKHPGTSTFARSTTDRSAMLLVLLAVVAATANPGAAPVVGTTGVHHRPLLDCTPAPAPPKRNDSSFRANLAWALAELPSIAAAAPGRAAALQSVEAGPDRVFARGFCFGAPAGASSAGAGACLACLTAAAADVSRGCGNASRRAGCFLAYADTGAASAHEDAFRGWFYTGPKTAGALAGGMCVGYRVPADCTPVRLAASGAGAGVALMAPRRRGDCRRLQLLPTRPEATVRAASDWKRFLWTLGSVYVTSRSRNDRSTGLQYHQDSTRTPIADTVNGESF